MRPSLRLGSVQVLVRAAKGNQTGIAGLQQHPNPRPALVELYRATLDFLHHELPQESVYKQSVSAFTQKRLEIVESTEDVSGIEQKIGNGLVEELLIQAAEEFELAKKMQQWESWAELEEKPLDDQWIYFGKRV